MGQEAGEQGCQAQGLHCTPWHLYCLRAYFPVKFYGNFTGIFPENLSLSGLIQREPKEADIWVNINAIHRR